MEFRLPGHVVPAGPNGTGKTTVLQAVASWSPALRRWRELNDFRLRRGLAHGKAPISRQAFSAAPLRSFDLLWTDRQYRGNSMRGVLYVVDYTDVNILRAWAATLARFIEAVVGAGSAAAHVEDMLAYWRDEFPPAVVRDPLGDHEFLNATKARMRLLPPLLEAAGLHGLPCTRYHEIAAGMLPEEIHPEVTEKLDAICRSFGVEP